MEKKGLHNRIYILEPKFMRTDAEARAFLLGNFPVLSAEMEIFVGCGRMEFCHAVVATSWMTAYFVRRFQNAISKFYFVQDFEPYFYPMGSEYMLAENTYRFGFRGITAGDWLKEKLEKDYGMPCDSFHFSYDKEVYRPGKKRDSRKRVFFYARPITARRGFELGLLALEKLADRVPDLEVVFAGGDISGYHIPFPHRSAGVVGAEELAEMYTQSDICLVMSLTNLSLLPLEIMACGGVVATQDGENNSWMLNQENVIVIDTDPMRIAETLAEYLEHPERLQAIRESGLRFAQGTDWERETEKVYQSIVAGVQEDLRDGSNRGIDSLL